MGDLSKTFPAMNLPVNVAVALTPFADVFFRLRGHYPMMKYLLYLIILVSCVGCSAPTHQFCVMPDGDEYHSYLAPETELWVKNGDKEIRWNTKKSPTALDNVVAVTSVALANSITNGN